MKTDSKPLRPRDTLLEALLALKALEPRISVNEIVAFLYTCENEGLSVQELAYVARLTQSTASRSLRSRAAQTLVLFMISVLTAVLLVAPQPPGALGAGLLAVAVVSGAALFILDRRAGHSTDQGVARYIERFSPNTISAVLVGVAGLTFLLKSGGGLYWLIPAAVASLLGGVVNAWLFLTRVSS